MSERSRLTHCHTLPRSTQKGLSADASAFPASIKQLSPTRENNLNSIDSFRFTELLVLILEGQYTNEENKVVILLDVQELLSPLGSGDAAAHQNNLQTVRECLAAMEHLIRNFDPSLNTCKAFSKAFNVVYATLPADLKNKELKSQQSLKEKWFKLLPAMWSMQKQTLAQALERERLAKAFSSIQEKVEKVKTKIAESGSGFRAATNEEFYNQVFDLQKRRLQKLPQLKPAGHQPRTPSRPYPLKIFKRRPQWPMDVDDMADVDDVNFMQAESSNKRKRKRGGKSTKTP
ncbi:hypothetical protein DFJ73DRAFT_767847 [Zopfochytrium polystomum]|nr:hypothetical protein DFJ73DRAFT_767847 [Zopfochytrium polystomum]